MIRTLLFCATVCAAAPALAEERDPPAKLHATPVLKLASAGNPPARSKPIAIVGDFPVLVHRAAPADMSLAEFDELDAPKPILIDQTTADLHVTATEARALKTWRVGDRLPAITSSANGNYAVRDSLTRFRKPRAFRPSAMSTTLVLKIDGRDDTEPFSVGGGGVAAALWKAGAK